VGETHDLLIRSEQHNQHHFKNNFTKAAKDWKVALSKTCKSKEDAIYLERFIKCMKSKKFIQKVIENPKILDDLLNKK
jgi:putative endonuclease